MSASVGTRSLTSSISSSTSESVKVVVRCRPLTQMETQQGHYCIVKSDDVKGVIEVENPNDINAPIKCFSFDAVYSEGSSQRQLYNEAFAELVDSVLNGFNGTILAYGQTGSGKTYTMEGVAERPELQGVIPNAVGHIFDYIAQQPNTREYLVRASYMEIYQEELRDLLNRDSKKRLELKERPDAGIYVKDLSSYVTRTAEEIEYVAAVGNSNRSVGRTNMNEHSSRSHAIFIITVECSQLGPNNQPHLRVGRLNLVDLAGSERQAKAGTFGQLLKEATKINLSLSALGNVISALVDQRSTHVPYRDSKLTRLLQDSLGGNARTVMVACVGPASYNYEETVNTLRYAARAKRIQNKPRVNEDPKDALLREYQSEIERLLAILQERVHSACESCRRRRELRRRRHRGSSSEQARAASGRTDEDALEKSEMEVEGERKAQEALASKIAVMQSKLLHGGNEGVVERCAAPRLAIPTSCSADTPAQWHRSFASSTSGPPASNNVEQRLSELEHESELRSRKLRKLQSKLHCKLQRVSLDCHATSRTDCTEFLVLKDSITVAGTASNQLDDSGLGTGMSDTSSHDSPPANSQAPKAGTTTANIISGGSGRMNLSSDNINSCEQPPPHRRMTRSGYVPRTPATSRIPIPLPSHQRRLSFHRLPPVPKLQASPKSSPPVLKSTPGSSIPSPDTDEGGVAKFLTCIAATCAAVAFLLNIITPLLMTLSDTHHDCSS